MKLMFWKKNPDEDFSKVEGLPNLADNVDDNFYIAAAQRAAQIDRQSNAYDQFLFSEDGMLKMPFEEAIDNHLSLVRIRLKDRGSRIELQQQNRLLKMRAKSATEANKVQTLNQRIARLEGHAEDQVQILEGNSAGHAGLFWKGSPPETISVWGTTLRLLVPVIVFIIVGIVDLGIIVNSLAKIPGFSFREAVIFTAPAVGIQLVFPHFIGDRIGLIARGSRRVANYVEIVILAAAWLGFCAAMTFVRMDYIKQLAAEEEGLQPTLEIWLTIMNVLMLVGLGSWLLFSQSRRNHHEVEYSRVSLSMIKLRKKLIRADQKYIEIQSRIPALEQAVGVTHESFEDAMKAATGELAETAKSVYRRALVNLFGSVDFTSSYIGDEHKGRPEGANSKVSLQKVHGDETP